MGGPKVGSGWPTKKGGTWVVPYLIRSCQNKGVWARPKWTGSGWVSEFWLVLPCLLVMPPKIPLGFVWIFFWGGGGAKRGGSGGKYRRFD